VASDSCGGRRRRARAGGPRGAGASPDDGPAPADAAAADWEEARRRANARLSFYTHAVVWLCVCLMLLVVTRSPRAALIVAASWGVGLAIHGFVASVVPALRRRLLEEEIGRRVHDDVSRERRALETRHARSLEDLSASIAHEIRNPVTAARSLVAQMGEDPRAGENLEYARVALDELDRVERSISHLLRYARDTELEVGRLRLADVVTSAVETQRERAEALGADLRCEVDAPAELVGDAEKLRRLVINLVSNALDACASEGAGRPVVEVMAGQNLAGDGVWLRVRDNGPGIDPAVRDRLFRPFFTTRPDGTGLGLALARKVAEAHGGSLEAFSEPGRGAEFVLSLPSRPDAGEER